jgi:hypothetical protein
MVNPVDDASSIGPRLRDMVSVLTPLETKLVNAVLSSNFDEHVAFYPSAWIRALCHDRHVRAQCGLMTGGLMRRSTGRLALGLLAGHPAGSDCHGTGRLGYSENAAGVAALATG